MKKKMFLILLIACVTITTTLSIFIFSYSSQSTENGEILVVYNQYVVHAQETGEIPLSYEEWLKSVKGEPGKDGKNGVDGLSAYQIWLKAGNNGTEEDFLNWLKGKDGVNGSNGIDGISAYQIWLNAGNSGTEQDFLDWLKGKDGQDGKDGIDGNNGADGEDGKSAYQIWLELGNSGIEADFIAWLKGEQGEQGSKGEQGEQGIQGEKGENGLSSYQIWLNAGNSGTEQDFLDWLKGKDGVDATQCEHDFGEDIELLSTCNTRVLMRTCKNCGISHVDSENGSWHNYSESIIEATCGEQGYTLHYCNNCSSNYKDNYTEKTNEHSFVELEVIVSTCTERKVLVTCSECNFNTVLIEETTVEHDYEVKKVKETCSEQGYTVCTCKICDYTYVCNYVDATGVHTYVDNICTDCGSVNNEAWDGTIATKIAKGNGSEFNPYLIQTGAELAFVAQQINGSSTNTYYYKHYKLAKSIDLGGQEWTPIGNGTTTNQSFRGVFDGNGFSISNFKISKSYTYVGLFGRVSGAIIKSLNINNFNIDLSSFSYAGAIAGGKYNGTIENCSIETTIEINCSSWTTRAESITKYIGGIVGINSGKISNCFCKSSLSIVDRTDGVYYDMGYWFHDLIIYSGGIVGMNSGELNNIYSLNNIMNLSIDEEACAYSYVGGVAGKNTGNINNAHSSGYTYAEAVSNEDYSFSYAGGFVGYNEGSINNSYSTSNVSSNSTSSYANSQAYAGGFVAYNAGEISNCYATGNVSAYLYTDYVYVGGFVGLNKEDATIDNCFRYSEQLFSINQKGIISNVPNNTIGNIVDIEKLNTEEFYINSLLWEKSIWSFNELDFENGKLPSLL